jgi:hypothetical protein
VSGFFLAIIAALLVGIGARDQATVAALSARQGPRPALLMVALGCSCACTAVITWLSFEVGVWLVAPARIMLAAIALACAGLGTLVRLPRKPPPREPTNSLFAAALVFLSQQLTDASRLLVAALVLSGFEPVPVAAGGAMGSCFSLACGWRAPLLADQIRLRIVRRIAGVLLIGTSLWLGVTALHVIVRGDHSVQI